MRTGTYVYCLIAAGRLPVLKRARRGLPGMGPVRLLAVPEEDATTGRGRRSRVGARRGAFKKWLAVADAPLALYGEDAINRRLSDLDWVSRAAVGHEAVVESFIEQPAVLPMKLFTIFMNDDRAVEHVHAERPRIAAVLERVLGHHEWGVRVVLDANAARAQDAKGVAARRPVTSGVAYLSSKKAQKDQATELAEHAREVVVGLYDRLDRQAAHSKRRPLSELAPQRGPLLLDAAFLVPHRRSRQFTATIARQSRVLAARGYHVSISGPWPPYSFIEDTA
jgi:hypothetical protein